jgi:hypothetical protein
MKNLRWIGHSFQKLNENIEEQALKWNPQEVTFQKGYGDQQ